MSVQSEINRIANNVDDALAAVAEHGVTVASNANSNDLGTLIRSISSGGDSVPSGMNIKYLIPCRFTPPRSSDGLGFDSYTFTFKRENVNQIFSVDWTLQDQGDNTTAGYWMQHLVWDMSYTSNYSTQHMVHIVEFSCGKKGNSCSPKNSINYPKTSLSTAITASANKGSSADYARNGKNYKGLLIIYDSTYTGLPIVDETKLSSFISCQYVTAGWSDSGGGSGGLPEIAGITYTAGTGGVGL